DADEAHLVQSAFTQRDWARSRDASFEQRARDFLIAHRVVVRAADLELVTGADGEQLVDRRIVVVAPLPVEIPTRDLHQARAATVTVLERDLFIDTDVVHVAADAIQARRECGGHVGGSYGVLHGFG